MSASAFSTEELHLAYRVVAALLDELHRDTLEWFVVGAAAEVLRLSYRSRTREAPLPGQTSLVD